MKIVILTKEYPPYIYGGAGVHVEYLTRELSRLVDGEHTIRVLCFGDQKERTPNLAVEGVHPSFEFLTHDPRHKKLMEPLLSDLVMAGAVEGADIVHCHTWYTHFAGCLLKQLLGASLVLTTHSLEPHRPWKEEQLGSAYHATTWLEKTAYQNADGVIAVSQSMRRDVNALYGVPTEKVRVIYNGIDIDQYKPSYNREILTSHGIDPDKPFILFVGRITRQKGIIHLVDAIKDFREGVQIVLCAGAPDTEEIGREMTLKVERARAASSNRIIWISRILPKDEIITLYSHSSIFVCPSIYEPFGIINLEAMACETPVVASAVGGIPEIVVHGETGVLVPFENADNNGPRNPERFSKDLASAVNDLLDTPERMKIMAQKARGRVEEIFSWRSIAKQTLEFYKSFSKPAL